MSLYVALGSRLAGLAFFGEASHKARAIDSARRPKTMNRDGSALRAIGSVHSLAHGSGTVWCVLKDRAGPAASASTNRKPRASSQLTRFLQAKATSSSRMTSSGMPT